MSFARAMTTLPEREALAAEVGGVLVEPGYAAPGGIVQIRCVACQQEVLFNTWDYVFTAEEVRAALRTTYRMEITDGGWACQRHLAP